MKHNKKMIFLLLLSSIVLVYAAYSYENTQDDFLEGGNIENAVKTKQ